MSIKIEREQRCQIATIECDVDDCGMTIESEHGTPYHYDGPDDIARTIEDYNWVLRADGVVICDDCTTAGVQPPPALTILPGGAQ